MRKIVNSIKGRRPYGGLGKRRPAKGNIMRVGNKMPTGESPKRKRQLRQGEMYRGDDLGTFLDTLSHPNDIMAYALSSKRPLSWEQGLVLASKTFSVPILVMRYLLGINPETGIREKNKSEIVGLGYNFARWPDTGEDSTAPIEVKEKFLDWYKRDINLLTRAENTDENFEKACAGFTKAYELIKGYLVWKPGERESGLEKCSEEVFMENFGSSLRAFRRQPKKVKDSFFRYFGKMADGMKTFLTKPIETIDDLREYNYIVAGLVGGFLTEVVSEMDEFSLPHTKAIPFGDFLQMANNIRDVGDDYNDRNKRIIWPTKPFIEDSGGVERFIEDPGLKGVRKECLTSLLDAAHESRDGAFDYILEMPDWLTGYTAFCTIPAILADKTYERIRDPESVKREEVYKLEGGVKVGRDEFVNVTKFIVGLAKKGQDTGKGYIHAFIRNYRENAEIFDFREEAYKKWAPKFLSV